MTKILFIFNNTTKVVISNPPAIRLGWVVKEGAAPSRLTSDPLFAILIGYKVHTSQAMLICRALHTKGYWIVSQKRAFYIFTIPIVNIRERGCSHSGQRLKKSGKILFHSGFSYRTLPQTPLLVQDGRLRDALCLNISGTPV